MTTRKKSNRRNVSTMLATAVLLAVVTLVAGCAGDSGSATDPRLAKPGNYVVVGPGAACELRAVPANGAATIVIPLLSCKPSAAGQSLSAGFTAQSATCGALSFGTTANQMPGALLGQDANLLGCNACGLNPFPACKLRSVEGAAAWRVVTLDGA